MRQTGDGQWMRRSGLGVLLALLLALLAACASDPRASRAPIEERRPTARSAPAAPAAPGTVPAPAADAAKAQGGADAPAKPGFYAVRPGDTLIRIALDHGQNWRDVQRWSNLDNPNVIEVGQMLRVAPPGTELAASGAAATPRAVAAAGRVESRPLDAREATVASAPTAGSAPAGASASSAASAPTAAAPATASASVPTPAAPAKPLAREGDEAVPWMWPASGPVVATFDEGRNKGVAIGGKAGDPVLAAADGRVVYAGSGLRGYGNLVIVKHNATYLTAYAHNQTLLVKDEQVVRRGQKIAEMGSSDADRVQLHFEIRRQGVPVDPLRLLPPR